VAVARRRRPRRLHQAAGRCSRTPSRFWRRCGSRRLGRRAEVGRLEAKVRELSDSKAALEKEVKTEWSARLALKREIAKERRAQEVLEDEKETLGDWIAALKAGTRGQDPQQVLQLVSVHNQ
jgi:hypothetical protein